MIFLTYFCLYHVVFGRYHFQTLIHVTELLSQRRCMWKDTVSLCSVDSLTFFFFRSPSLQPFLHLISIIKTYLPVVHAICRLSSLQKDVFNTVLNVLCGVGMFSLCLCLCDFSLQIHAPNGLHAVPDCTPPLSSKGQWARIGSNPSMICIRLQKMNGQMFSSSPGRRGGQCVQFNGMSQCSYRLHPPPLALCLVCPFGVAVGTCVGRKVILSRTKTQLFLFFQAIIRP